MPQTRQTSALLNEDVSRLEALPERVVAYGRNLAKGEILPFHCHRRAQLIYASSGVMTVTTRLAAYVVPPQRAVWTPSGVEHQIEARSAVAMRTLYIDPTVAAEISSEVCVLHITPLLRELIITAVATGRSYGPDSPQSRIMSVILDQIASQPVASLALPMPTDSRLHCITQSLIANPADSRSLGEWASEVGASKRTLGRLFAAQTGMSFRSWRQQRRLLRALELLAAGDKVTTIAFELGYENTSAFIAMFRRCFGTTPRRYLHTTH
jgi:AraC-like DNA-binding protein/quercetin dioxygenase-like cupin family protein